MRSALEKNRPAEASTAFFEWNKQETAKIVKEWGDKVDSVQIIMLSHRSYGALNVSFSTDRIPSPISVIHL
jgi:hypothetical protein